MYVKLFSSLYQGTLRGKSDDILVFTNLLAYCDQHGIVDKHFKAIADETGLDLERVQAAIERLEAPDSESRSPEMNGCRIVRLDEHRVWGWRVVNYGKYRAIRSEEDRREQNRLAQERYRERHKVSKVSHGKPPSAQGEGEEEETKTTPPSAATPLPEWLNRETWGSYIKTRPAKARKPESLKAAVAKLEKFKAEGYDPNEIVATSLANGWQGLFRPKDKPAAKEPVVSKPVVLTCAYCDARATGTVGGVRHCARHIYDAMDGRKIA